MQDFVSQKGGLFVPASAPMAFAQNSMDEVRLFGGDGQTVGALAAEPGMKQTSYVAHAIQAGATRENPSSGPDGIGVQEGIAYTIEARSEVQAVAFDWYASQSQSLPIDDGISPPLKTTMQPAVAFNMHKSGNDGSSLGIAEEHTDCLRAFDKAPFAVHQPGWAVRRLTPTECHRLQGFPDGFCNIPWRGNDQSPDGPQYKALGNSMAVNCMRWLGQRIEMVENIIQVDAA